VPAPMVGRAVVSPKVRRHRQRVPQATAVARKNGKLLTRLSVHDYWKTTFQVPTARDASQLRQGSSPRSFRPPGDKNRGLLTPRRANLKSIAVPITPTPYETLEASPIDDDSGAYDVGQVTSAIR